jgi:hypothetical protein
MPASAAKDATGVPLTSARPAVGRASQTIILNAVGLPGAVRPEKARNRGRASGKRQLVDGLHVAVLLRQALGDDR